MCGVWLLVNLHDVVLLSGRILASYGGHPRTGRGPKPNDTRIIYSHTGEKKEFKIDLNKANFFAGHSLGEYTALASADHIFSSFLIFKFPHIFVPFIYFFQDKYFH